MRDGQAYSRPSSYTYVPNVLYRFPNVRRTSSASIIDDSPIRTFRSIGVGTQQFSDAATQTVVESSHSDISENPKPSTSSLVFKPCSNLVIKPSSNIVKSRSFLVDKPIVLHEAPEIRTEMSPKSVVMESMEHEGPRILGSPATAHSEPLNSSLSEIEIDNFVHIPEVTLEDIQNYLQKCQVSLPPSSETGATNNSQFTYGIFPSHVVFKTEINIGTQNYSALVDTGASFSAVHPEVINNFPQCIVNRKQIPPFSFKLSVGNDSQLIVNEKVTINFYSQSSLFSWQFYVIPGLSNRVVLGMDWLRRNNISLDCNRQKLIFGSIPDPMQCTSQFHLPKEKPTSRSIEVKTEVAVSQPPPEILHRTELDSIESVPVTKQRVQTISVYSSCFIPGKTSRLVEIISSEPFTGDVIVNPDPLLQMKNQLAIGTFLVSLENGRGSTYILNLTNNPSRLTQKTKIGTFEKYENNSNSCDVDSISLIHLLELIDEPSQVESSAQMFSLETGKSERSQETMDKLNSLSIGEDVTPEEKEKLIELLERNLDLFSFTPDQLGRSNSAFHKIDTGDAAPIRQRAYRVSPAERELIKARVQEMIDRKMIEPSDSPWSSPVILVQQKDKVRFCVDYRKLNAVTKKDCYPLPRIDDTLDHLSGARFFSSMDLDSAFHQVSLAPEDKEKSGFQTPFGHYIFNVMPFGLCNAPSTFQRLIDNVLGQLKWSIALVYLDDTIVFSKTFEEHLVNLALVFNAFRKSGLTLKPTKCKFAESKLDFLGHIISADGVSVNPKKVNVVKNFPQPKTVKDIQSFVSLCSYFRKFIENFSKIAQPLLRLTQKGVPFVWDENTEKAFQTFKDKLTNAPILAYPVQDAETSIHTDACGHGLGAALYQKQNNVDVVIAYASRSLTPGEKNYAATHLECLAVVWAIETFRPYIYGQKFKVVTDHHSLCYLLNLKDPNGQLARWCLRLMPYNFEIVHKSGATHTDADILSRYPVDPPPKDSSNLELIHHLYSLEFEDNDIVGLQRADKTFLRIIDFLLNPNLNDPRRPKYIDQYKLINNILYRANYEEHGQLWRLVVPRSMRSKLISYIHVEVAGHLGLYKTYHLMKSRYYWPGIYKDVVKFYNSCQKCQLYNRPTHLPNRTSNPLIPPKQAFERIGIDYIGPFPSSFRYTHALVIVCHLTRYTEIWPVFSTDAKNSIKILERHIIFRHSPPKTIVLDRDSAFTSLDFRDFAKQYNIELVFNPAYYHQPNGICERHNDTIKRTIAKFVEKHKEWSKYLHRVAYSINISKNKSTKTSPFYLVHGRHPNLENKLPNIPDCIDDDVSCVVEKRVQEAIPIANANTVEAQQTDKRRHDMKHKSHNFKLNDIVLYRNYIRKGEVKKFEPHWQGPFQIIRITRDSCLIENRNRQIAAHSTQLKHYKPEFPASMPVLSIISSSESHESFKDIPTLFKESSILPPNSLSPSHSIIPEPETNSLNEAESDMDFTDLSGESEVNPQTSNSPEKAHSSSISSTPKSKSRIVLSKIRKLGARMRVQTKKFDHTDL